MEVVASLASRSNSCICSNTTAGYVGVYTGAAAAESLAFIVVPSVTSVYIFDNLALGTRISVRSMTASNITAGLVSMQFSG